MEYNMQKYTVLAEMIKALAHPVRLCIVKTLLEKGECNVSHMQTCLDIPQPTVSQNLQKLINNVESKFYKCFRKRSAPVNIYK